MTLMDPGELRYRGEYDLFSNILTLIQHTSPGDLASKEKGSMECTP